MLHSEDGERMSLHNNSTLIKPARPSDLNNGRTMLWKSNPTEDQPMLDSPVQLTQDIGNCSNSKLHSSSMNVERSSISMVTLMLRTETLKFITSTVESTSNGTSSMLMNIQMNQSRVSSTKNSVSTFREISSLSPRWPHTDISNISTPVRSSSRHQTPKSINCGTSIKFQRLSRLE
jgi:hypothetical protein